VENDGWNTYYAAMLAAEKAYLKAFERTERGVVELSRRGDQGAGGQCSNSEKHLQTRMGLL